MNCIKKEKRNLFSLFTIYDCNRCIYFRKDETIIIGRHAIQIYSITPGCWLESINDEYFMFNKMLAKLLLEFSVNQENNLFLWFDGFLNIDNHGEIFSSFLNIGYNIHIINM
ncbi:MAG TPA: hypothetical protein GXZ48_01430 [Acholeplasmataceae bacterium]|jgi:hypothetical protein|nr:hypothetical protein [Acholeplasmataceae bacterium]